MDPKKQLPPKKDILKWERNQRISIIFNIAIAVLNLMVAFIPPVSWVSWINIAFFGFFTWSAWEGLYDYKAFKYLVWIAENVKHGELTKEQVQFLIDYEKRIED